MIYKVTPRTESLVAELGQLVVDLDGGLLASASSSARQEWNALRIQWPTLAEIRVGSIAVSDDELAFMAEKVRRFRSILRATSSPENCTMPAGLSPSNAATIGLDILPIERIEDARHAT